MFKKFLTSVFALILSISMINSNPGVISANNDNEPPIRTGGAQSIDANNLKWVPVSGENPLGGAKDFNAILFEEFSNFHESGGPIAAGSFDTVNIVTFKEGNIGGPNKFSDYAIPKFNISLISKGPVTNNVTKVDNGDILFGTDGLGSSVENNNGNIYERDKEITSFFNDAREDLKDLDSTLWKLEANGVKTYPVDYKDEVHLHMSDEEVNIFELDFNDGRKDIRFLNPNKDSTIIIKLTGDNINVNNTYLGTFSENVVIDQVNIDNIVNRILWVVDPSTENLELRASDFYGSVLAPFANVSFSTDGTSVINGQLIAKSFKGNGMGSGSEFHYVGGFTGKYSQIPKIMGISVSKKRIIEGKELSIEESLNIGESITVNLLANGVKVDDVLLNNMNNWSFVFSELPIKDDNGNDITYTVEEAGTTYDAIITGSAEDGFTITNNVKLGTINIPVEKVWFGTELDNIEIQLLQTGKSFGEPIELSKSTNWKAVFNNLPKTDEYLNEYEYTVKELEVPGYYSEITEDESGGFIVTNIEKTSISVTKEWRGGYGDIESIDVSLVGGDSDQVITLNAPDFKGVFTDLPKYNKDGNPIEYKIEEVDVPEGYTPEYNWLNDKELVIKNNRTLKTEVSVSKTWIGKSLDSIVVVLYADGKEIDDVTLSAANSWNHTFRDLPYYNLEDSSQDGLAIDYTIQEYILDEKGNREELSDKLYNQKVIKVYDKESQTYKFDITNEFIVQTTNLPYKKIWQGEVIDGQEITVQVTQIDSTGIETILEDMTQTLTYPVTEGVFENLPMSDADGNPYLYTISEVAVDGYASKIKVVDDITTITNTRSAVQNLHFKKIWETKEEASIVLNVYRESTGSEKQLYKTLNINGIKDGWSATLIDVPVFDTLGNPYTYSVEEAVDESYQSSVNRIEMDNDIKFEITNKFVSKTTTFDVTKKWNGEILEGLETIQVQLIRTSTNPDDKSVKEYEPITLSKENKWKATFPREYETHDPYGFEYEYEVKEFEVADYESEKDGLNVTNTYVSEKTSIAGTKTWIGGPEVKPEITIALLQDGTIIDSVTLKDGELNYEFTDLDVTDVDGKPYTYDVKELEVEDYESVKDGFNFTNTFNEDSVFTEKTSVSIEKIWVGTALEKIEVFLHANNEIIDSVILSEETDWKHTFNLLELKDENEELIVYSISEAVYEEYTTDITEEDQIFIIVNTLIEEPEEPGDGDKPEEPSDGDKPGESGDSQVDSAIKQDGEEKLPSTGSFAILPNLGTASIVLSSLFWLFGKLRKEEEEEK